MRFTFILAVMLLFGLKGSSQTYYCYSSDTIQSDDNFIRIIVDSFGFDDVTKTIFKIESTRALNFKEIRFSVGTPDILLKRTLDFEVINGKLKLTDNPFMLSEGGETLALYISYEFSWAGPLLISRSENDKPVCKKVTHNYPPLITRWETRLLQRDIVPSRDAIALLRTYNPRGINEKDSVLYPYFVSVSPEEQVSFNQQYVTDTKPDKHLAENFKKEVRKLGQRIQSSNDMQSSRGEVSRGDLMRLQDLMSYRRETLKNLYELHDALNDIIIRGNVYQMPEVALKTGIDEIGTVNEMLQDFKDSTGSSLLLKFIEDLQLLAYPYAPNYHQNSSGRSNPPYRENRPSSEKIADIFHFASSPEITENHLRQFHFYIYKNAEPAPKKQYRVYCVPAGKFEYYLRRGKDLKELSLYMSQELASVASQNLPLAIYYIFAIKTGETKWSDEPQRYHMGRMVRESTDRRLPYSFCINVKN